MTQNIARARDILAPRAPGASALERYSAGACIPHVLTPPIGRSSALGFHRRVCGGAGARRFYVLACPMLGGRIWPGSKSSAGSRLSIVFEPPFNYCWRMTSSSPRILKMNRDTACFGGFWRFGGPRERFSTAEVDRISGVVAFYRV